jgi:hypothetical protein
MIRPKCPVDWRFANLEGPKSGNLITKKGAILVVGSAKDRLKYLPIGTPEIARAAPPCRFQIMRHLCVVLVALTVGFADLTERFTRLLLKEFFVAGQHGE